MSYLCVKANNTVYSFSDTNVTPSTPYISIKNVGSFPLTTITNTNRKARVKISNSTYAFSSPVTTSTQKTRTTLNSTTETYYINAVSVSMSKGMGASVTDKFWCSITIETSKIKPIASIYNNSILPTQISYSRDTYIRTMNMQLSSFVAPASNVYAFRGSTQLTALTTKAINSTGSRVIIVRITNPIVNDGTYYRQISCDSQISGYIPATRATGKVNYTRSNAKFTYSRSNAVTITNTYTI